MSMKVVHPDGTPKGYHELSLTELIELGHAKANADAELKAAGTGVSGVDRAGTDLINREPKGK